MKEKQEFEAQQKALETKLAPLMLTVLFTGLAVQVVETILKIQILFGGHRLLIGTGQKDRSLRDVACRLRALG